jgi:DNA-binding CsgD family transcriptional regulator
VPVRLSACERTILRLVADGRSDKQIARELTISVHTVRTHLDRMYKHNGVHNRAAVVAAWFREREDLARNATEEAPSERDKT